MSSMSLTDPHKRQCIPTAIAIIIIIIIIIWQFGLNDLIGLYELTFL